jgi:hypothetical protein
MQLKGNRDGMVRFAAIVGVADSSDPGATVIEFTREVGDRVRVAPACQTPGCTEGGDFCKAYPGTRYVRLAQLFGLGMHGFVDSICQSSFTSVLAAVGEQAVCPRRYHLSALIPDPDSAVVSVNGNDVPKTVWEYIPPSSDSPGGSIVFVPGYWPCSADRSGEIRLEVREE